MEPQARLPRILEVVLFVVVIAAGTVLTAYAVRGPETNAPRRETVGLLPGATSSPRSQPAAPPATLPPFLVPTNVPPAPGGDDLVRFTNSRSNGVPDGCTGHLTFFWEAGFGSAPPEGSPGIIELTGPDKAGRYTRPFKDGRVTFEIDVPLGSRLESWEAKVITVDGRPTDSVKLGWSFPPCR
jgi:hypothetical protein